MMKRFYTAIILFVLLGFLHACKKKELPETENYDPVFMLESTVNGNKVALAAGKDNYYMYTSYQLDNLGINVLKGTLRSKQCEACNHEFSIEYRDSYYRNNLIINNIADVLKQGHYNFFNGVDTSGQSTANGTSINFTAYVPPGSNYTYNWNFGDGVTSTLVNPTHQYTEPADYNVCLTVSSAGYPSKTVCNVISMDTMCRIQFNQTSSQNLVNFYTIGGANSYAWNFGDTTAIQLSGSTISHTYNQAGIYRVVMKDTLSGLNCGNVFQKDILIGSFNGNELAAGFNYTTTQITPLNPLPVDSGFRKVTINYTSANGIKYSTYNPYVAHNQINNTFVVTKAEPYQNNSAGQKTYKMEGNFKAWFYNVNNSNDSIYIETNKFIMGVAFP
ncbi:MAG TPA: PKD domain-containing protein [Bacteroidia bacterium]|nr:PKD domain-containing protein [Bacteroidia bacterium]